MSEIGKLDRTKAALRLLIVIYESKKTLDRDGVFELLNKKYRIGKTAGYSAIKVCKQLGLIEEKFVKTVGVRPSVLHSLTEKGKNVAEIIVELEKALSQVVA